MSMTRRALPMLSKVAYNQAAGRAKTGPDRALE
jgi:hypothetical protein